MTELKIFKHKPIRIEAIQYTGENLDYINKWFGELPWPINKLLPGTWVVRNIGGYFSIWDDEILKETYEETDSFGFFDEENIKITLEEIKKEKEEI